MITAIPVQNDSIGTKLSGHFGSAPFLALINNDGLVSFLDRSKNNGDCASVKELCAAGVDRVICIGMGRGALDQLNAAGINTSFVVKAPGRLDQFIIALDENSLILSQDIGICIHPQHNHSHECSGHKSWTGQGTIKPTPDA